MKRRYVFWSVLLALLVMGLPAAVSAGETMLVSAQWLATQQNPLLIFDLDTEDDGMYIAAPAALASSFDIERFLTPDGALLPIENLEVVLGQAGIRRDSALVLYDNVSSLNAAFMFFVLDYLGHERHYILDGGIDAWLEFGGAVSQFSIAAGETTFKAMPRRELIYVTSQMRAAAGYAPVQLIDSRPYEDYAAGHIPSATSYYWGDNLARTGSQITSRWRSWELLSENYSSLDPAREVVCYGANGMAAAHNYFAAKYVGFPKVAVYVQSWRVWERDELPADTSASQGYALLDLNLLRYRPLDIMDLRLRVTNPGPAQEADLYVLLEVYGTFYFFPSWSVDMDRATGIIAEGKNYYRPVLHFQMPSSLPAGTGPFTFFAVTSYLNTYVISSRVATVSFYF